MDDERIMKRRIGALVLVMLGVLFALIFLFADQNFQWRGKGSTLKLSFSNAPGVVPGTPISRSGIRIGRVTDVSLQEDGMVLVTSTLDPGKQVFQGDSAMVVKPLMGDSEICISSRIVSGKTPGPGTPADLLVGEPYQDPMAFLSSIQGQVAGTLSSIEKTSDEMRSVFANVNEIVGRNRDTIEGMLAQAKTTTEILQRVMAAADSFLVDSEEMRANVRETLAQAPKLLTESREAVQSLSQRVEHTLSGADQA
ncbi:MAG: MlaD family protein, partial [Planctomycetia bacterium]|nr:MlaD family protein [Planctomycetia bacterium]